MIRSKVAAIGASLFLAVTGVAVTGVTGTAPPAQAASSYINIKNSVNSDHHIRAYRDFSPDRDVNYLNAGENAVLYNGDDSVRIKVYIAENIKSYQYYYGGTWHACHTYISNDISNPTNDYYDVTIRTFIDGDCEGRN